MKGKDEGALQDSYNELNGVDANQGDIEQGVVSGEVELTFRDNEIPGNTPNGSDDGSSDWGTLSSEGEANRPSTLLTTARVISVPTLLYCFVVGLKLVGNGAKVAGGRDSAGLFDVVHDPAGAIAIGELITVALQSSSTATSLIVSLVGANELNPFLAMYMVFGANIGTTMTNNLVALFWYKKALDEDDQFAKGFATSSMHDFFNMWSLMIAVILQTSSNFYWTVSRKMTEGISDSGGGEEYEFFDLIVDDLMKQLISPNKDFIKAIAKDPRYASCTNLSALGGGVFADMGLDESAAGALSIILGLFTISVCLYALTKVLRQLIQGQVLDIFQRSLNINPYLNIVLGCGLTILMQSSSVVTSVLTALNLDGYITRDQMFPLQIGSNWGTTVTGILAAMSALSKRRNAMTVALSHLLFNLIGTVIYPVEKVRDNLVIKPVDYLEKKIQERPWGAFVYLGLLYGAFPGVLLAGSMIAESVKPSGSDQSLFNNATASNSTEAFECTLDRRLFELN